MKFKIRKGDIVSVIAGKDKGKQGKVLEMLVDDHRVRVEGINRVKRHTKPNNKNPQGGIFEKEAPIHISNVMLLDSKSGKPARVRVVRKEKGSVRVFKKSGSELK